ncbi:MAG: hypothetical protein JNK76_17690, partial [Planctomycetales bacterium]|nr:hypothetical protein [Planctomycetales bacterium]
MASERRHRRNYNIPGHAHELTFSCFRGLSLLNSDRTRNWLAESIQAARSTHAFDLWAWVFMDQHAHLLLRPRLPVYDIGDIRRAIKEPVAREAMRFLRRENPDWMSKLARRRGERFEHLFWASGGGYDRNITTAKALKASLDYIHLNPVKQGFVAEAADWKWSSAAWYVNGC